jgi:hypothetical protein
LSDDFQDHGCDHESIFISLGAINHGEESLDSVS